MNKSLKQSALGKKSSYINTYSPKLLYPLSREIKRKELGLTHLLPFHGYDRWTCYEVSWLNPHGKPMVAIGQIIIPATTPNLIESKSLKLYLNSFNNHKFSSASQVEKTIKRDLTHYTQSKQSLFVKLSSLHDQNTSFNNPAGICLDNLDIHCTDYFPNPIYLQTQGYDLITEQLYTNLLKSNCLVTGQPDWGTLEISYTGIKIAHAGLLKYIISLRNHNEFHEQCIERIFTEIWQRCQPQKLAIQGYYTRRGGIDINPYRSNEVSRNMLLHQQHTRLVRQ